MYCVRLKLEGGGQVETWGGGLERGHAGVNDLIMNKTCTVQIRNKNLDTQVSIKIRYI